MSPAPVLERLPALGAWRAAWDDLVLEQPLPSPFQRSWWLDGVGAGREGGVLLVRSRDQLLGGLALDAVRRAGVTAYGPPGPRVLCPDHLDAVAAPGSEGVVVHELTGWFSGGGQRLLDLRGVVPDSLLHRAVGGTASLADVAPYAALDPAAGEDGYLASRSSGFRRNVRRGRRRLGDLGLHHHRVAPDGVGAALDDLRRLLSGRDGREDLLEQLPVLRAAVGAGVQRGEARLDVLASDTTVVAVTIAFVVAGRLGLYQVARSTDPEHASAGTVLLAEVIEDARRQGCHEVDLLRGDETYKESFADATRPLLRVRAARGTVATGLLRADDLARRTVRTVRSVRAARSVRR